MLPYSVLSRFWLDGKADRNHEQDDLANAVNRLWPFFRHPSAAARESAMHTLLRLLCASTSANKPASWVSTQLLTALHLLLEALLVDPAELH